MYCVDCGLFVHVCVVFVICVCGVWRECMLCVRACYECVGCGVCVWCVYMCMEWCVVRVVVVCLLVVWGWCVRIVFVCLVCV